MERFWSPDELCDGKHFPGYAGIPPWTRRIPPDWDGMESVPASYKCKIKFLKKLLKCSDPIYFLISFIILPLARLSLKQPLKKLISIQACRNWGRGVWGGCSPPAFSQIFDKVDFLPTGNDSEMKKRAKKYKPPQNLRKLRVRLLFSTSGNAWN